MRSGFDLAAVLAEYRALRASVIRLWRESDPELNRNDLDDLTRFNESIDQSLTEAVRSYTAMVDRSRQLFLAILGHDLRNPLNSVLMSAGLLSESKLDPDAAELSTQITTSANAMAEMIKDLLDFTASELGSVMPLAPAASAAWTMRAQTPPKFSGICMNALTRPFMNSLPSHCSVLPSHGAGSNRSQQPVDRLFRIDHHDTEPLIAREGATVGEVMTSPPITVSDEASIVSVASVLASAAINRVPVLQEGRLVGIISRADIVRFVATRSEWSSQGD